jgi:tetrathionate reductase subunit B
MKRRDFLKAAGGSILLATSCTYAFEFLTAPSRAWTGIRSPKTGRKWGMVIDLTKCRPGCTACLDACHLENNTSEVGDRKYSVHWIRKVQLEKRVGQDKIERSILLLCNHCENPPCAQVCPVQATYKRHDGIVIVDAHRCIGCRYCMIACPYNARCFNFKDSEDWPNKNQPKRSHGVAEACDLCAHRLDVGKLPACVEKCREVGPGCIHVGDLNDPSSDVHKLVSEAGVKRLREGLGLEPKVYYVGL